MSQSYRLRITRPALKLRVSSRIPNALAVDNFLTLVKANGVYTFGVDYELIGEVPVVGPTTSMVVVLDRSSSSYKLISLSDFIASAPPTATTLGGVFSHAVVPHFFVTGINTDGSLFTAQPAAADLSNGVTGSGAVVLAASPTLTGTLNSAAHIITSTSGSAFAVGPAGTTNSALNVDASVASLAAGLNIIGAVTGGPVRITVTDSGANGGLTINGKGSGAVTIGDVSTGAITLSRATTISAALTYGGVTLSNAVTGTGNMVLGTAPTIAGAILTAPALGTPVSGVATNLTGTAAGLTAGNVTTNANLTGEVTSVGNAATLTNSAVIAKVLTGYTSGAGTVAAADSILAAIQKLNGNDATNANLTGVITSVGNATSIASQTGTGTKFVVDTSPTLVTPVLGVAAATTINKVTITAPATAATLTVPDGVTLTGPASSGTAMTLGNTETVTGIKTFGGAGAVGKFKLAGTTSGSTIVDASATASGTITIPAATDTLVGKATTDTLTNKTFDTAGAGNSLSINGVAATANTGTGAVARAAGPTFTTPALGVATATSINGNFFTAGTYTLAGVAAKTFTFNNTLTLAGTDSTTMTFPTTSATLARTDAANTFTGHQTIEGVTSTGATGTGKFVFDGTPTLVTPVLGVASATSINKVAITSPATAATLTLIDGTTVTGPATTDTLVGRATTDTLTNKTIAATANTISLPYFSASLSASQSMTTAVAAKLLINTELTDSNNWYDNATNYRFTPLLAGKYRIAGYCSAISSGGSLSEIDITIRKNGTTYSEQFNVSAAVSALSIGLSHIISFNGSTDYVELWATVYGTSTLTVLGGTAPIRTWFEAQYIGP